MDGCLGWLRRKKRNPGLQVGCRLYNDGIKNYRIKAGDYVEPTWRVGLLPRKKKDPKVL